MNIKNWKSKVVTLFVCAFLLFGTAIPANASGLTESQIQAIISLLSSFGVDQGMISNVGASLRGQAVSAVASPDSTQICSYAKQITRTLYEGSSDSTTGGQVTILQKFLASDSTVYPEGTITGYFGPATERAVQRWQAKNNIVSSGSPETNGYGVIGSLTRAALVRGCGSSTPIITSPTTTTPPPTVTLSASRTSVISDESSHAVTLYWSSTNATACYIEKEEFPTSGSVVIDVVVDITEVVSCTGPGGRTTSNPVTIKFELSGSLNYTKPQIYSIDPSEGSVNTTHKIYGINLNRKGTIVQFYNSSGVLVSEITNISFSGDSPLIFSFSEVFAENTPSGTYTIKVNTADGTSNGLSFVVTDINNPSVSITSPKSYDTLTIGTPVSISWNAKAYVIDDYQVIVGNYVTGSERQLYDRVSEIGIIDTNSTETLWNVPNLLSDFAKGSSFSNDQIKDSFYLQINLVKNDSAGSMYVGASNKIPFSVKQ